MYLLVMIPFLQVTKSTELHLEVLAGAGYQLLYLGLDQGQQGVVASLFDLEHKEATASGLSESLNLSTWNLTFTSPVCLSCLLYCPPWSSAAYIGLKVCAREIFWKKNMIRQITHKPRFYAAQFLILKYAVQFLILTSRETFVHCRFFFVNVLFLLLYDMPSRLTGW